MNNSFPSAMEALMKGMNSVLSAKSVVGEPTQIGDTTIVPLVDVSFGAAAGATDAVKKNGTGGGFGGKVTPSAVLVIKDGYVKLVNVKKQDSMTKILDMVPDLVDRFTEPKGGMDVTESEAIQTAFPKEAKDESGDTTN
ncbi:MAG: GerW family sporulation protein [Lachnospiraceae bacterium]|nr:GerW family sporulation protein [Lachnospiraceae bacterium]